MKIGILTFHRAYNFGAQLQAYGLQQFLLKCGYEVEIIDYRNRAIEDFYDYFSWKKFRKSSFFGRLRVVYFFFNAYQSWKRRKKRFQDFIQNYLIVSGQSSTDIASMDLSSYEGIIVGSDQVWNPQITGGFDAAYWGDFHTSSKTQKITYAASCTNASLFSPQECSLIKNKIANFKSVSVRENSLKQFCEQLTHRSVSLVLDPTLLVERTEFYKITSKRVFPFPYVLVYAVEMHPYILNVAKELARRRKAKVLQVAMPTFKDHFRRFDFDLCHYDPSIPELLSLFKYAECTVTLSFHGVALSVVYEKDFFALKGSKMSRVNSLLEQLNLSNRIVEDIQSVDDSPIDYMRVNRILEKLRDDSELFIKESLKE